MQLVSDGEANVPHCVRILKKCASRRRGLPLTGEVLVLYVTRAFAVEVRRVGPLSGMHVVLPRVLSASFRGPTRQHS